MKKTYAILPAALMVLMASCSNATSDTNNVATPPASPSSMAPPVGATPGGEAKKDHVEVNKSDSAASALPHPNTADTLRGTGGGR